MKYNRHQEATTITRFFSLGALLFLYRDVLKQEIGPLDAVRVRRPKGVPLVLSVEEVRKLLAALDVLPTTEP